MNFALYVGLSGDKNFGDWWLYDIIKKELAPLRLLPFDRLIRRNGLRNLACNLWDVGLLPQCKCMIVGGGTIMMPTPDYLIRPSLCASKKRYSIGTGAYSLEENQQFKILTKEQTQKLESFYSSFERITVRGPLSAASLKSVGVKKVEIVGDPFLDFFTPAQIDKKNDAKNVVVNVADIEKSQGYYWSPCEMTMLEFYSHLISDLSLANYSIRLAVCAPVDLPLAIALAKRHALPAPTIALNVNQFDELLHSCGRVIATRLHFLIYSVLRGVPTASLNYQDKHLDFWQSISPQISCYRLSGLKTANLLEKCERDWSEFTIQWDQLRSQIICLNGRRAALYHEIRNSLQEQFN